MRIIFNFKMQTRLLRKVASVANSTWQGSEEEREGVLIELAEETM